MPYLIDRRRALHTAELVAIVTVGQQRMGRTRVTLRDNSWYHTLTRPRTLRRRMAWPGTLEGSGGGRRPKRPRRVWLRPVRAALELLPSPWRR
jgi:hypothetical protein